MAPVPDGYPVSLDDEELDAALVRLIQTPATWPNQILPELTLALIGAGVQEKTRRETKELRTLVARAVEAAVDSSARSFWIALLALVVSGLTLVVTLVR